MLRLFTVFGFLFLSFSIAFSQKELSLAEAVSGQYQQFYPEHIFEFQWRKTEKEYSYVKLFRSVVVGKVGGEEKIVINVKDINESLGTSIFHLLGMKWINDDEIIVNRGKQVIIYNIEKAEGTVIELPDNAENVTFSPTYQYVAYTKENNLFYSPVKEFSEYAITSFNDKNIVSGQAIAREEMGISNGIFWSKNGNYLAFYQKDESQVHDYPLLDISGTPGTLKSIKYPMAGQESERPKVGLFSIKNNEVEYITTQNGEDYYLTNLSWTPDEKYVVLAEVARSQKHIWVQKYSNSGKFEGTLLEETADTWVEPERPAFFPSSENNNFVWISERDGFDNLYYYSIEGKLLRQLTQNKFVLKEVITAQNGEIFYTATGENPLNTLLYKVNLKGKQTLLTQEEGTHEGIVNSTGAYVFDQYSAQNIPNRAVIRQANGKIIQELLSVENPLKEYDLPKAEIKTIKVESGTELYTRMIKPKDFDASKKYPVLIYVYGGPHAQLITNSWLDGASLWMHWMANQGYIVFTLDNRGSANRGVDFEHIIHRELGVAAYKDQMAGVEYLKTLSFVNADRIAVHGWSFGGFMSIYMMLNAPEIFKVGVAGGPVTDWKFYEVMYGERYMDTPEENPEGYRKTSLLENAENMKGELLMIHGSIDPVVVPQHSLALIKRFVDLGIQTDFYMYPMHEHNVSGKDRVHLIQKVLEYILEKNK